MGPPPAVPRHPAQRPSRAPVVAMVFMVAATAVDLAMLASAAWPRAAHGAPLRPDMALGGAGPILHHVVMLAAAVAGLVSLLLCRRAARAAHQADLAEVGRRLELAMEASQVGFWDADLDHDRLLWDERARHLMGAPSREGFFGEADWLAAVHPEDRERAGAAAEAAIATRGRSA